MVKDRLFDLKADFIFRLLVLVVLPAFMKPYSELIKPRMMKIKLRHRQILFTHVLNFYQSIHATDGDDSAGSFKFRPPLTVGLTCFLDKTLQLE